MENLPDDVLSNIFIRLLAKQLAGMRCVSKSFNALLSQSSFIKSHLHHNHSIHNTNEVLLVFMMEDFSFHSQPFTAHSSPSPHLQLTNFIKSPSNPPSQNTIIGSVNGLICFSHKTNGHFAVNIWNPSLSAMLYLPQHSLQSHDYNDSTKILFRFAYEPETDDYKVVKLTGVHPSPNTDPFNRHVVKEWLQVEVYSMRKDSWELITQRFPSDVTRIQPQHEVCVDGHDGHLHWLCYVDEVMKAQTIVAFHLGAQTFCKIPLPDSILDYSVHRRNVIGVLAGKLCLISSIEAGKCEVWVMDEYGLAESWVKRHIFSQFSGIAPIGFTLHNEFVFIQVGGGVTLYDPIAAKVKLINTMAMHNGWIKIVEYIDSLVWIVPTKHEISSSAISHFEDLERGIVDTVNGPRETKAKKLVLLASSFLIITFMMIFLELGLCQVLNFTV